MLLTLLCVFPVICGILGDDYDLVVETSYGEVGGVIKDTKNSGTYYSFTGIPFAKPPVGDLRFANPEAPDSWDGVLNATVTPSKCVQRDYFVNLDPSVEGDEDCLYLNVYVPQKNNSINDTQLPVMVQIPWGGFVVEGSDTGIFGPTYIMDYDVILVTLNYRVGIFGFFSTFDDEAPGNFGLKDQVMALKWVQENIENFGGIKENVTIAGQSAGGSSVHYHLMSPASEGLFANAISQSGSALTMWSETLSEINETVISIQAETVNCSDYVDNSTKLVNCLRKVSASDVALSDSAFKEFYLYPMSPYLPVVETESEANPTPFLTKRGLEYLESGEFRKVPWLTGTVKNEGMMVVSALLGVDEMREDLNSNFDAVMPELLKLWLITNDTEGLFQNISEKYLGGNNYVNSTDEECEQGLLDLCSDRFITYPTYQAVSLQVAQGHDSIYFYSFEYTGEYTLSGVWANGSGVLYNANWSISHADDLLYMFEMTDLASSQLTSDTDIELSNTLLSLWVNFATYGNPNPSENLVFEDISWEPVQLDSEDFFTNDGIYLLNITGTYETGPNFNITQGFNEERMSFWDELS